MLEVKAKPGRKFLYLRGTLHGHRYDESTETTCEKTAQALCIKRNYEIQQEHIHGKAATATFAQAALRYLEQGGNKRFLEPLLLHFGRTQLTKIKQDQIDRASILLYPNVQPSTRNRQVYAPMSAVLHYAASLGWCPVPKLKRPKSPPGRVRWLTKAEAAALEAAAQPFMRPLIRFLLYTGARAGEALWLDWRHVDLDRQHVDFVNTKNGTDRGVPLHTSVVEALRALPHRKGCVFLRPDGQPYARPNKEDDRDTSAGTRIKTGFAATVRRAGLTDFTPHDCRHTWATWHYQANRDLIALMQLGGWKNEKMVLRYAHMNVDQHQQSIDRI